MKPLGNILCKKDRFVHSVSFFDLQLRRQREWDEPRPPQDGTPAAPPPPGSPQRPDSGRSAPNGCPRYPPACTRCRTGRFPQKQRTGSDRDSLLEFPQKNRNNTSVVSPRLNHSPCYQYTSPKRGNTTGKRWETRFRIGPMQQNRIRTKNIPAARTNSHFFGMVKPFCFFQKIIVIRGRLC